MQSESQQMIYWDNRTCCHTEKDFADETRLTLAQLILAVTPQHQMSDRVATRRPVLESL